MAGGAFLRARHAALRRGRRRSRGGSLAWGDWGDGRLAGSFGAGCPTLGARMEEGREKAKAERVAAIRRRMYSISEYMRMIKQWFSEDYNRRNGHKGTMWEAIYGDHAMSLPDEADGYEDIRDVLAYIHLNPIRAAMTDRFDGYAWSSYAAYRPSGRTDFFYD